MKRLISMRKVVQACNVVVLDEKNPHIQIIEDGTVIKLDVIAGCTPWTYGCASTTLVRFSAGKDSEWLERHKQTCKTNDEVKQ